MLKRRNPTGYKQTVLLTKEEYGNIITYEQMFICNYEGGKGMGIYRNYIYPSIIEALLSRPSVMAQRKDLLRHARGEILEIGFGTGLNLSCYPEGVKRITIVESNQGMNQKAAKRVAQSNIQVDCRLLNAESLPFEDGSFDTVVSAFTFCSIKEVDKALREIYRVLKPDGQLLFLEHGLSPHKGECFFQNVLNPVYRIFSDGCHLNRDVEDMIKRNGFNITWMEQFYDRQMIKLADYLSKGMALKNVNKWGIGQRGIT